MRNTPAIISPDPSSSSSLPWSGNPYNDFLSHSAGQRIQTSFVEVKALRTKYPDRHLTIVAHYANADLLAYVASGQAKATLNAEASENLIEHGFVPPARRHGGGEGSLVQDVRFAAYDYEYQGATYLLYYFYASEGMYSTYNAQFVLSPPGSAKPGGEVDEKVAALIAAATLWANESHEEVWVFDRGFWSKDREFYKSVQNSNWDDVILDKEKKQALIDDVEGFFSSEQSYKQFSVPWKRGLIFYGPPGNGKTISIKALMHSLTQRTKPSVDMLYVKTFNSFQGPEYGILSIFMKARQMAPCMLIFEDIDSLVSPMVRSYFLNAVDGLESNHGILMIGSTNHLERLDPGIAKRPSRFDRKYLFALPVREERVQYAQYWRHKLADNKEIDFPEVLCDMIAEITDDFSFAYLKEAFVAALLAIVASKDSYSSPASLPTVTPCPTVPNSRGSYPYPLPLSHPLEFRFLNTSEEQRSVLYPRFDSSVNDMVERNLPFRWIGMGGGDDDSGRKQAEKTILWKEIKKQIEILRGEMDNESNKNDNVFDSQNCQQQQQQQQMQQIQSPSEQPSTNPFSMSYAATMGSGSGNGSRRYPSLPPYRSNLSYPSCPSYIYPAQPPQHPQHFRFGRNPAPFLHSSPP